MLDIVVVTGAGALCLQVGTAGESQPYEPDPGPMDLGSARLYA